MARTNTAGLKLAKRDVGDLNWGGDFNESLDVLDAHAKGLLRAPRTIAAALGAGAVGPNLSASTTYTYRITALLDAKESNVNIFPSTTQSAVTQGGTAVPVALAWEATEGATGYRIYRAVGAGAYERIKEIGSGATVVYTDSGNDAPQTGVNPPAVNDAAAVVLGIRKQGEALFIRGALEIIAGANVTLTQDNVNRAITIAATGGGSPADASSTVKGITKLSVDPVSPTEPIAAGTNDNRIPTQAENDALAGTSGSPSSTNKYMTDEDPRNTNSRTPTAHALGGAAHSTDTFANLSAKVSDATLVHSLQVILQTLADAKGDIIAASAADTWGRLAVGVNGHVLQADSTQALGVKWAVAPVTAHAIGGAEHTASTFATLAALVNDATLVHAAQVILQTLADAKGDLIAATGSDAWARLAVGADGQVLQADSTQALGVKWATVAGGGGYATQVVAAPTGVAATDTAAINAAIAALPAGGGMVALREGVYVVNASIVLPAGKPIALVGQGKASIIRSTASNINIVDGPASGGVLSRSLIANLSIESPSSGTSTGLKLAPAGGVTWSDITVSNVRFHNLDIGIMVQAQADGTVQDLYVLGCTFTSMNDAIKMDSGTLNNQLRTYCRGNTVLGGRVRLSGVDTKFQANYLEPGLAAGSPVLFVSQSVSPENARLCIEGNTIKSGEGILISGNTPDALIANNNIVPDGAATNAVNVTAALSNSLVSGNRFTKPFTLALNAGTTGNIITGNSGTVTDNSGQSNIISRDPVDKTIVNAKGDLIAGTADNAVSRLGVGTNGQVLTADSAQATGMKWDTPQASPWVKLADQTPSSTSAFPQVSGLSWTTAKVYKLFIHVNNNTGGGGNVLLVANADGAANYSYQKFSVDGATVAGSRVQSTSPVVAEIPADTSVGIEITVVPLYNGSTNNPGAYIAYARVFVSDRGFPATPKMLKYVTSYYLHGGDLTSLQVQASAGIFVTGSKALLLRLA